MADNLQFPILFDLDKGVDDAFKKWNSGAADYSQIISTFVLLSILIEALVLCELRKRQVVAPFSLLKIGSPISPYMLKNAIAKSVDAADKYLKKN